MRGMRRTAAGLAMAAGLAGARGDVAGALDALKKIGKDGGGNAAGAAAWKELAAAKPADLPKLLAAWKGLHPVAANYLHSAATAVANAAGADVPAAELESFLKNTANAPDARRLAFEIVAKAKPDRREPLLDALRDDPSMELRFDAVAQLLGRAADALKKADQPKALAQFELALNAAREQNQVAAAAAAIRKLGKPLDLARHFGFVQEWRLIGPFDNAGGKGWDAVYQPEKEIAYDGAYESTFGKVGKVKWFDHQTADESGTVDLNKVYKELHKGSATYALAEYVAKEKTEAEIRLGSIVAWKLWLNGAPLSERNESHAGYGIDQYTVKATFLPGRNRILLKLCQNEQTEQWAQNYMFGLRVCDANGTAILAANRPAARPALAPAEPEGKAAPKTEAKKKPAEKPAAAKGTA